MINDNDEPDQAEVQWQIVTVLLPYRPESEVRPGKWDFAELLDLTEDWSGTDDAIVFDSFEEALVELDYRMEKMKR